MYTIIFRQKETCNLNLRFFFTVFAGGGSLAFSAAAILATLLANAVKAVWGTNLGINGINLRPSIAQSVDVFGPAILQKWNNMHSIRNTKEYIFIYSMP